MQRKIKSDTTINILSHLLIAEKSSFEFAYINLYRINSEKKNITLMNPTIITIKSIAIKGKSHNP
jgi:hypothetical protein